MDRPETISLLRMGHDEIVTLRRRIAAMEPKAHAYDTIAILARQSEVRVEQGYGVDVAGRLENAGTALSGEREAEALADSKPKEADPA